MSDVERSVSPRFCAKPYVVYFVIGVNSPTAEGSGCVGGVGLVIG